MQKARDIAAVVLAALLVVGLAVVSVRGLIDPRQASLRLVSRCRMLLERCSIACMSQSRHRGCKRGLSDQAPMDAAAVLLTAATALRYST
jgi:hypothetical protein